MHPIIRSIQIKQLKKVPNVRAGYTVRVSQKITEGTKERVQRFEGLVIQVSHGEGVEKTFTVRKIVEGIGVEKVFPFHSPNIVEIKVIKKAKVRRSKLYYMSQRFGKSARLSERQVSDAERAEEMKLIEEAMAAQQAKEETEAKANVKTCEKCGGELTDDHTCPVPAADQDAAPEQAQELASTEEKTEAPEAPVADAAEAPIEDKFAEEAAPEAVEAEAPVEEVKKEEEVEEKTN